VIALPERARDVYQRVSETKDSAASRDVALLVARIVLAWVFIYHGGRTLFGWFGGPGVHRASIFYGTIAHLHPATFFTVLGGSIELFGGAAVGLGVFGRFAAACLAGDMAIAMATVTLANGMASSAPGGGYELNLGLAGLAFVVALVGTGRYSGDDLARRRWERAASARTQPPAEVRNADRPDQIAAS